jgi:hypothetical protein
MMPEQETEHLRWILRGSLRGRGNVARTARDARAKVAKPWDGALASDALV